jgi:hypothetical protein
MYFSHIIYKSLPEIKKVSIKEIRINNLPNIIQEIFIMIKKKEEILFSGKQKILEKGVISLNNCSLFGDFIIIFYSGN